MGWLATLQALGLLEDSPLRNPNRIPFPGPPTVAQNHLGAIDEEETQSIRELVEVIDSHVEAIDLEATTNLHVDDQPGEVFSFSPALRSNSHPRLSKCSLPTPQIDCRTRLHLFTSLLLEWFLSFFPLASLLMSPSCGDRTIIFPGFNFFFLLYFDHRVMVTRHWFSLHVLTVWLWFTYWTIALIKFMNVLILCCSIILFYFHEYIYMPPMVG